MDDPRTFLKLLQVPMKLVLNYGRPSIFTLFKPSTTETRLELWTTFKLYSI